MKKKKIIIVFIVILAAAAAGWYFFLRPTESEGDAVPSLGRVERGNITRGISVTGKVEPQNRLEIQPTISGRIEKVLVREGQIVKRGDRLALMSSTERASLLDAAQLNGPEKISYWEEVYKPSPLLAPIDGTVIVRGVEPGQTVSTSSIVLVLSDRLIVKAEVDETDIGMVRLRQKASITLDAYPDDQIPGVVDHIAYESTVVSNVTIYQVDILPEFIPDNFRSGMSAEVSIIIDRAEDVLMVPSGAIKKGKGRSAFVLIPDPGGEPRRREVQTGLVAEGKTEITSGLEEGEQFLVSSVDYRPRKPEEQGSSPFMPSRRGGRKKR
jgi:membrane fusion protein, macrolide-specific efflux system